MDFDSSNSGQWDWLRPLSEQRRAAEPQPPELPNARSTRPEAPPTPGPQLSTDNTPPEPAALPSNGGAAPKQSGPTAESVSVVREAAVRLAATQYDPNHISRAEIRTMLDLLKNGHVITSDERDLLSHGPRGYAWPDSEPDHPRDLLGDWQARYDNAMASGNMGPLARSIEALSILTRIRMAREMM